VFGTDRGTPARKHGRRPRSDAEDGDWEGKEDAVLDAEADAEAESEAEVEEADAEEEAGAESEQEQEQEQEQEPEQGDNENENGDGEEGDGEGEEDGEQDSDDDDERAGGESEEGEGEGEDDGEGEGESESESGVDGNDEEGSASVSASDDEAAEMQSGSVRAVQEWEEEEKMMALASPRPSSPLTVTIPDSPRAGSSSSSSSPSPKKSKAPATKRSAPARHVPMASGQKQAKKRTVHAPNFTAQDRERAENPQFYRPLDLERLKAHRGCGQPLPYVVLDGLLICAYFLLGYHGPKTKLDVPTWDNARVYDMLCIVSERTHELMGFNFRLSPIRGWMTTALPVLSAPIRLGRAGVGPNPKRVGSGEDPNGSKPARADDQSQGLSAIVTKVQNLSQEMHALGIQHGSQLFRNWSRLRSLTWYVPGVGYVPCTCMDAECRCVERVGGRGASQAAEAVHNLLRVKNKDEKQKQKQKQNNDEKKDEKGPFLRYGSEPCDMERLHRITELRESFVTICRQIVEMMIGDLPPVPGANRLSQSQWSAESHKSMTMQRRQQCQAHYMVGKGGLLRASLYGKRTFQSGRTVAGPLCRAPFASHGIPVSFATTLSTNRTFAATPNRAPLIDVIRSGRAVTIQHQGRVLNAEYVRPDEYVPPMGAIIERQLRNGDVIMCGRQPTLHRAGISSGMAYVHPNPYAEMTQPIAWLMNSSSSLSLRVPRRWETVGMWLAERAEHVVQGWDIIFGAPVPIEPERYIHMSKQDGSGCTPDEALLELNCVRADMIALLDQVMEAL
jgi:hypothetical protein